MKSRSALLSLLLSSLSMLYAQEPENEAIQRAIKSGVAYLIKQQDTAGNWEARSQPEGATALVLLALLKSGVAVEDPVVKRGLMYLYANSPHSTYSVSLLIMALEAGYYPDTGAPVKVPEKVRSWLQGATNWLLNVWDGDYWTYASESGDGDLSNTQFAVLALRSASQCGIKISPKVWQRLLGLLLSRQQSSGPPVEIIGGVRQDGETISRDYPKPHQARGWGYKTDGGFRGSMTAAGVTCMLIVQSKLKDDAKFTPALRKLTAQAIGDGLAWLALHFTVETNPQSGPDHGQWHYYYLYGLERAGQLSGFTLIGSHNWYQRGARYLVDRQQPNGMWNNLTDTCFALLFLKKATKPLKAVEKSPY
jgi:hypothetical protein